jgi:hypothetical protein
MGGDGKHHLEHAMSETLADSRSCGFTLDDLFLIEQLVEKFPSLLTVQVLRWQLRHRKTNGLAPAVVKVGKHLLISKTRYETWLTSKAGGAA